MLLWGSGPHGPIIRWVLSPACARRHAMDLRAPSGQDPLGGHRDRCYELLCVFRGHMLVQLASFAPSLASKFVARDDRSKHRGISGPSTAELAVEAVLRRAIGNCKRRSPLRETPRANLARSPQSRWKQHASRKVTEMEIGPLLVEQRRVGDEFRIIEAAVLQMHKTLAGRHLDAATRSQIGAFVVSTTSKLIKLGRRRLDIDAAVSAANARAKPRACARRVLSNAVSDLDGRD